MPAATDREQVRETLAALAQKASAALPAESAGRLACAVKLVLAGDVTLAEDGTALVKSATDPAAIYRVNGTCPCKDFARAPEGFCKHKIARALMIRLTRALPQTPPAPAAAAPLPEAPASVNCRLMVAGRECQATLRDSDETRLLARLAAVLTQYPQAPPTAPKAGAWRRRGA